MLHAGNLNFSAKVIEGVSFAANNAEEVRRKVVAYLDENTKIDWIQVIEVSEQKPFGASDHAFIGIEIDRFYLGKDKAGETRRLRWDDYDEHFGANQNEISRIVYSQKFYGMDDLRGAIILPHITSRGDGQITFIPYSEPAWAAVNRIREAIIQIKEQLRETLGSEEGIKRLESFGSKMMLSVGGNLLLKSGE